MDTHSPLSEIEGFPARSFRRLSLIIIGLWAPRPGDRPSFRRDQECNHDSCDPGTAILDCDYWENPMGFAAQVRARIAWDSDPGIRLGFRPWDSSPASDLGF